MAYFSTVATGLNWTVVNSGGVDARVFTVARAGISTSALGTGGLADAVASGHDGTARIRPDQRGRNVTVVVSPAPVCVVAEQAAHRPGRNRKAHARQRRLVWPNVFVRPTTSIASELTPESLARSL